MDTRTWARAILRSLPQTWRRLRDAPGIDDLIGQRDQAQREVAELRAELSRRPTQPREDAPPTVPPMWAPVGHYYSPLPDLDDVRARRASIFASRIDDIPGVELNPAAQLALLERLSRYYPDQPFDTERRVGLRYHYGNGFFSHADGLVLYCMLRHLSPRRYLEIGSGFSSALALDVNQRFLGGAMQMTLIEPDPERLFSLLLPGDRDRFELLERPLQEVEASHFAVLEPGDVLFVDSSHVSKVGSDVNRILFEILPGLSTGVYVHIHDVFASFEYPEDWILEGRAWNEQYLVRAFLQYNRAFEIVLLNEYMAQKHRAPLAERMPLYLEGRGQSLWLRKTG